MKKMFTLLSASVIAVSAIAAPIQKEQLNCSMELTPAAEKAAHDFLMTGTGADFILPKGTNVPGMKKAYADEDNNSYWQTSLKNLGWVGDNYSGWTDGQGNPVTPTLEQLPYYLVIMRIDKDPLDQNGDEIIFQWNLWWPSMAEWMEQVDGMVDPLPENHEWNFDAVPFEALCNIHENELYPDITYCSVFKESDPDTDGLPFPDYPYDANDQLVSLTVSNWGMYFGGGLVNGVSASGSGYGAGNASTIDFQAYDSGSQWLDYSSRMFINTTKRYTLNFSAKARVQGWAGERWLAYPEIGRIHVFNTGINGSSIAGDTDEYGIAWGPLQTYYVFVLGKYIKLQEENLTGAFDRNKISLAFDKEKFEADKADFYEAQSFFYGTLFAEEGFDFAKGGSWTMAEPYQIGAANKWVVKPEAMGMVPMFVGDDRISDGWVGNTESYQDIYYPGEYGTKINFGTTKGFQAVLNNDLEYYEAVFDGEIYYHYDMSDMGKFNIIDAVGDLEPSWTTVEEISVENVAPVYYNLQGVRVANPEKGLFIKVQGKKVSKVVF